MYALYANEDEVELGVLRGETLHIISFLLCNVDIPGLLHYVRNDERLSVFLRQTHGHCRGRTSTSLKVHKVLFIPRRNGLLNVLFAIVQHMSLFMRAYICSIFVLRHEV